MTSPSPTPTTPTKPSPSESAAAEDEVLRVLVFEVEKRRYGLPSADVVELVRAASVEPLPDAPPNVDGVLNVRGEVVPVFSLRRHFGLAERPAAPSDHFIVTKVATDAGERKVVVRTDRVVDLVELPAGDARSERDVVPGVEHLTNIARLPEGLMLIFDLNAFLGSKAKIDVEQLQKAAAAATGPAGRPRRRTSPGEGVIRRREPSKAVPKAAPAKKTATRKKTAASSKKTQQRTPPQGGAPEE